MQKFRFRLAYYNRALHRVEYKDEIDPDSIEYRFFLFPAETIPDESESRSQSSSSSRGSTASSSVGAKPAVRAGRAVFQSLPFGKAPQLLAGKRYEREPPKKSYLKMPCLGREEALVEHLEDDQVDWKYYRMKGKEGRKFLNLLRAHEIPLKLGAHYRPGQPVKLRAHNIEELNELCPFAEMAKKWRGVDKDIFNDFTGKITTSDKAPVGVYCPGYHVPYSVPNEGGEQEVVMDAESDSKTRRDGDFMAVDRNARFGNLDLVAGRPGVRQGDEYTQSGDGDSSGLDSEDDGDGADEASHPS